jgi:hypothetical protein
MPVTSATHLESLRLLADAPEATLEFQLGMDACVSSRSEIVRLAWSGSVASLARGAEAGTLRSISISVARARACAAQVADLLLAQTDSRNDRSTTRHHGRLRWDAPSTCSGSAEWSTTSMAPELVAEVLGQRPELASRLPPGPPDVAFLIRDLLADLETVDRVVSRSS